MSFEDLQRQYDALRDAYASGRLSEADFQAALEKLRLQDAQGRWWTIGAESGQWYVYQDGEWVRAEPPRGAQQAAAVCPQCGAPLEPGTAFCGVCGSPVGAAPVPPPPSGPSGRAAGRPPRNGGSRGLLIAGLVGLVVLAVVALTVGGVLLISRGRPAGEGLLGAGGGTTVPPTVVTVTPTSTLAPTETLTPEPATERPTSTATVTATPGPTDTSAPVSPTPVSPTATREATVTPQPPTEAPITPTPAGLSIQSFSVDVEDLAQGKRLTFAWRTTGASDVRIISGTSMRFPQWWDVDPEGTLTVELASTNFRNPEMQLQASDEQDNQVTESIAVEWPCQYAYFFQPGLEQCPADEPIQSSAAEQPFEGGRMLWLEQVGLEGAQPGLILVLYDNGSYEAYQDTWTAGEPEIDSLISPPDGFHQPRRGFGKIWRETSGVRGKLGWALAPEQGFNSAWQRPIAESLSGSRALVRTFDGQVIQLWDWGLTNTGHWETVSP